MDKITEQTLAQLDQLAADLHHCQRRLEQLGRAKVPVYFFVPLSAQRGFAALYSAVQDMKSQLQDVFAPLKAKF